MGLGFVKLMPASLQARYGEGLLRISSRRELVTFAARFPICCARLNEWVHQTRTCKVRLSATRGRGARASYSHVCSLELLTSCDLAHSRVVAFLSLRWVGGKPALSVPCNAGAVRPTSSRMVAEGVPNTTIFNVNAASHPGLNSTLLCALPLSSIHTKV